jgi:hypothetical protein
MPVQNLTYDQQRAVERLAWSKGIACVHCGSTELHSGDTASVGHVWVNVALMCANPNADHVPHRQALDKSFNFTPEEAARIGIRTLPDPLPRRPTGGSFPTA